MNEDDVSVWITEKHPHFESLTTTVVSMLESMLRASKFDFLAVSGRTKSVEGIKEKIKRKKYSNPSKQLTDISGVRVIVYFEAEAARVADFIEGIFKIDAENSKNRDTVMSVDQIGYRSIHYVCELGESRTSLPEYAHLSGLKFEIQVRTVLQHAWAEIAHDRNYKFSGKLPRALERNLFLYAGLLEVADKGFDQLSRDIDSYAEKVREKAAEGDFDVDLDSVSLENFFQSWADKNGIVLGEHGKYWAGDAVLELEKFGIQNLRELEKIIPRNYAQNYKDLKIRSSLLGVVRDWMIMTDDKRYRKQSWKKDWSGLFEEDAKNAEREFYEKMVGKEKTRELIEVFGETG